jgi:site-specific DNA-methyltransferase (adenine-specific)
LFFVGKIATIKLVIVMKGHDMEYTNKLVTDLIPYASNARTHSEEQVTQIASSIREFGFINPIIIDDKNNVIAGHGRLLASKKLGLKEVPTLQVDHLTDTQRKAYILADNQLALNAGWDDELLKLELAQLDDVGFDLELLGFDLDALECLGVEELELEEQAIPEPAEDPVSKLGDIWTLGNHRLMCGDSTQVSDVEKLMGGFLADLLHTDPPYNVNYDNQDRPKASKVALGKIKNDTMSHLDFYEFLKSSFSTAYLFLKKDSSAYIWHSSSEQINFTSAFIDSGFNYTQQIIWKKPMLLGRGRYQWSHEPCLFGVKGSPYFTDDRTKTTVWDFGGYDKSKNVHPTQKPAFIPEEAIRNSSKQGSNVLDLFGGSGSTLIACEKLKRKGFIMELDPKYCDVIIKRWQNLTGNDAVLESTGKTYNSLEA